jgi:hypothetical protein
MCEPAYDLGSPTIRESGWLSEETDPTALSESDVPSQQDSLHTCRRSAEVKDFRASFLLVQNSEGGEGDVDAAILSV